MTCVPDSVRWAGDVATEEAVMSVLCVFKRRPTSRRPHTSLINDADPGPANMRARALELARTCPSTGDATLYPGKRDLGAPLLAGERVELPAKSIKRSATLRDVTCRVLGAWLLGRKPRRQVDGEKGQYGFIASRVLGQNIRKDQSCHLVPPYSRPPLNTSLAFAHSKSA